MIHCRVCVPPPARREGDALLAIDCFSDIDMLLDEAGSATLRGGSVAEPRAKLDSIIAGSRWTPVVASRLDSGVHQESTRGVQLEC